jgi:hypothetical protein
VNRLIMAVLAGACLAGCVSQLSNFKKWEAAQQPEKIEVAPISSDCTGSARGSAECAQLQEIQARACLTLASREAAPGAACPPATDTARKRLKCAADGFAAAKSGNNFPADQRNEFSEMRARALYCRANLVAAADGISDVREASRELAMLPDNPRRDQLAAAVALYVGNSEELSAAERCDGARRSVTLADRGLADAPSGDILTGLTNTRDHAVQVIKHLPSCKAP